MQSSKINWPRTILRVGLLLGAVVIVMLLFVYLVGGTAGAAMADTSAVLMIPALGFILVGGGLSARNTWLRWGLIIPGALFLLSTLGMVTNRLLPPA